MSLSDALSITSVATPALDDQCLLEVSQVTSAPMPGPDEQAGTSHVVFSPAPLAPLARDATGPVAGPAKDSSIVSAPPAHATQPDSVDRAYLKGQKGGGRSVPQKVKPVQLSQSDMGIIYFSGGEHTLQSIERVGSTRWTEEEEAAYLLRVNEKARAMAAATAAQVVAKARDEAAAVTEAARQSGYEEGYESALATAESELEEVRSTLTESVSALLAAMEDQRARILVEHCDDLAEVTRIAVAKMAGVVLSEERRQIIGSLLEDSLAVLEDSREVTVNVSEEDEAVLREIMALVHKKQPESVGWKIKTDASITPGGIRVESAFSLAASTVESRQAAVEQALLHLSLLDDEA